jgi:hypothetical protein
MEAKIIEDNLNFAPDIFLMKLRGQHNKGKIQR